jgi:Uma2 family endonuclease
MILNVKHDVMSILTRNVLLSQEEYLEGEKYATIKHEYVAGHAYAMVGVSQAHALITINLAAALHSHLRGKPCRVFSSDMKVRVGDAFYYPDIVVSCDSTDRQDYYLERPALVIEVLSSSTEQRDRGDKRLAYQSLPSLQEYVLVAQDKPHVEILRRRGSEWDLETYAAGETVAFTTIGLDLPIAQIFEDV